MCTPLVGLAIHAHAASASGASTRQIILPPCSSTRYFRQLTRTGPGVRTSTACASATSFSARTLRKARDLPEICQKLCLARPRAASPDLMPLEPLSCDVVMQRGVSHRYVRCLRSLHTAEVTGSIPVTPTSTNRSLKPFPGHRCQQIASKPPVVAHHRNTIRPYYGLSYLGELGVHLEK
jgi:hypothetical protein